MTTGCNVVPIFFRKDDKYIGTRISVVEELLMKFDSKEAVMRAITQTTSELLVIGPKRSI